MTSARYASEPTVIEICKRTGIDAAATSVFVEFLRQVYDLLQPYNQTQNPQAAASLAELAALDQMAYSDKSASNDYSILTQIDMTQKEQKEPLLLDATAEIAALKRRIEELEKCLLLS